MFKIVIDVSDKSLEPKHNYPAASSSVAKLILEMSSEKLCIMIYSNHILLFSIFLFENIRYELRTEYT